MMSLLLKIDEFVRITSNKTLCLYLQDMLLIILYIYEKYIYMVQSKYSGGHLIFINYLSKAVAL